MRLLARQSKNNLDCASKNIELRKIEFMNNWIEKWDGRQPSVTMGQSGYADVGFVIDGPWG